ncbi:MAG: T9SS type A sorting domain-containing protein [Bacteroidota bacterium]
MSRFVLLLMALLAFSPHAQAQFPFAETFTTDSAPGWVLARDAKLTGGEEDANGDGWLRLTNNDTFRRGYAFLDTAFPSTEGVVVDIQFAIWGDTFPGDGFTLFLFDGALSAADFDIGEWGGSLGYANGCTTPGDDRPGLAGAYVGIGFDEFGNFANPGDRCKNGGPGRTVNSLTVRGAANTNDTDDTNDYPFVATTGTLTDLLSFRQGGRPDQTGEQYRRAQIAIIPSGTGFAITVNVQFGQGGPLTEVIAPIQLDTPPPATLKLGFGSSTGDARSFHEIRNVEIGDATALPVELTSFRATSIGEAVQLDWATSSETVNAGFYIEMVDPASGTGTYATAGFMRGAGTTAEAQRYSFRLDGLPPGTYQFRLRQVDFDGTFEYSPEVEARVSLDETFRVAAFPNPFSDTAEIEVAVAQGQAVRVEVFDVLGRRVATLYDGTLSSNAVGRARLDGSALPPGLYLVRIQGERFEELRRLTRTR